MCNACIPALNQPKDVDTFSNELIDVLNHGALALMISIGHRTGLFDVMDELPPSGSDQIAEHAGLNPRYVTEWLAAMVSGGVVVYEPTAKHYILPSSHASLLCRRATPDNIAVFTQYIGLLGSVEDRVVDCFRNGGGVAYEHFPRFHEVMAEDSGQTVVSALDEHILPLIEGVEGKLERGIKALDIGCGKARALLHLAERFPNSEFWGYDFSEEAISEAEHSALASELKNIHFEVWDLTHFDQQAKPNTFDLITAFDAIHDQAAPQNVLDGIYRSLKSEGTFLMQDIRASSHLENNLDHPIAPLLYTLSTMHCMTVSLAQNGAGLGTMWGEELAVSMLTKAGFDQISVNQLDHDFQNNFYIMTK